MKRHSARKVKLTSKFEEFSFARLCSFKAGSSKDHIVETVSKNDKSITNTTSNSSNTNPNVELKRIQYGNTRLLLNEPVYIPKNIGTIAPITVTLQKINNHYRNTSKNSKAINASIKYQNDLYLKTVLNYNLALQRIVEYLPIRDRLNLRATCKAWKSIVDSDRVWKRLRMQDLVVTNWAKFGQEIVAKHKTRELIFDGMLPEMLLRNKYSTLQDCFPYMDSVKTIRFVDSVPLKAYIELSVAGLPSLHSLIVNDVVDNEDTLDELESLMRSDQVTVPTNHLLNVENPSIFKD